jgi:Helix-turn-helix domain
MTRSARASRKPALSLAALPALSKTAENFVRSHPSHAKKLVAAALEAAAIQYAPSPRTRVPDSLKRFQVRTDPGAKMITISEAAQRLKISRTTAYDWIERKRMIGWKATKAGMVVPGEQIAGAGEIVKGIDGVLEAIGDPRAAWRFLDEASSLFDKPARPMDLLKKGQVDAVLSAAEALGEAFA